MLGYSGSQVTGRWLCEALSDGDVSLKSGDGVVVGGWGVEVERQRGSGVEVVTMMGRWQPGGRKAGGG